MNVISTRLCWKLDEFAQDLQEAKDNLRDMVILAQQTRNELGEASMKAFHKCRLTILTQQLQHHHMANALPKSAGLARMAGFRQDEELMVSLIESVCHYFSCTSRWRYNQPTTDLMGNWSLPTNQQPPGMGAVRQGLVWVCDCAVCTSKGCITKDARRPFARCQISPRHLFK